MKKPTQLFLLLTAIISFAFTNPKPSEPRQINVMIDAGHGGTDFGAVSNTINEKQIVEQIANKIKALNKNKNVVIHFTRNSDELLTLQARTQIINTANPDIVLSLHVNSSPNTKKSGMEFFVANKDLVVYEKSNDFAVKLSSEFSKNSTLTIGSIRNAPFYILKNATAPTVLIELGYLSNENDKKYLIDSKEQDKIAENILEFVSGLN
jgi:N-acetylmuramoyl-L-alanine amidase